MRVRTSAVRRTSHGHLCGVFDNRAVDIFRCTLGMRCSREDGAIVLGEDVQPGCNVGCMILARFKRELEIRTQERGSKLSDQLLERIAIAAETMPTEVTIEPARGPVRAFVGQGRIVAIRIAEAHERRHLDCVVSDAIERAVPTVADGCTKNCEEPLRALDPSNRIKLWDGFRIPHSWQPIDLLDIEYGVTLQEREIALDLIAGFFIGLFASNRVGIDDQRALLPFTDVSVKLVGSDIWVNAQ